MSIVHGNETRRAADHASPAPAEGEQQQGAPGSPPIYGCDEAGDREPGDPSLVEEEAGYGYGV